MDRPGDELIQRLLAAASQRAAERAADVIEAAEADAVAEVRAILKSAMKAALLERATVQLEGPAWTGPIDEAPAAAAAPARADDPARDDAAAQTGCYVYCVTTPDHAEIGGIPGI